MAMNTPALSSPESISTVGRWVIAAFVWSALVVLGCLLALLFIDFGVESTTEFVVLVRNIALMGAAAIALPVSLYLLGLRERTFRMDLTRIVREEVERQKREVAEEIERRETELREDEAKREKEPGEEGMVTLLQKMSEASDGTILMVQTLDMSEIERQEHHVADLLVDRGLAAWKSDSALRITAAGYDFLAEHGGPAGGSKYL